MIFPFMRHVQYWPSFSRAKQVARAAAIAFSVIPLAAVAQVQTRVVEGHALHASSNTPLPGITVLAWPCGQSAQTDADGLFRIECSTPIDSITASGFGLSTQTVQVLHDHVNIRLSELRVAVGEALVEGARWDELESQGMEPRGLMQALDRTPGLQSLDLGGGMVQPVIRGLYGTRVNVLEDGVPQRGARWGADHGVLVSPELQVSSRWVPGSGHVWVGPEGMGGGLRFESPSLSNTSGVKTRWGSHGQMGSPQGHMHILHTSTQSGRHWHAGASYTRFGTIQIPQRTFTYIGRSFELESGELPNTGGESVHAVLGAGKTLQNEAQLSWTLRASDVHQGMFPGIVGVPVQGDLAQDGHSFDFGIPLQRASRLASLWNIQGIRGRRGGIWEGKLSSSWNRRLEHAPPHAHGWGPEPSTSLSLSLEERALFAEARCKGLHSTLGVQLESQQVDASGWEFLVPSHSRLRSSLVWEARPGRDAFSARFDVVHAEQVGHSEPLYNAIGDTVGTDVRALPFSKWMPGGMASWQRRFTALEDSVQGRLALAAHGRIPSNYEWGANGIHHGTFRFEQGNPALRTEWTLEGRSNWKRLSEPGNWGWEVSAFVAMHKGFISLTPSASFAPISHAGQVYVFQANDAFRSGMEASAERAEGMHRFAIAASALGQWELATGLGLPFTTPSQVRLTWEIKTHSGLALEFSCRALAKAVQTARNEPATPGAFLVDLSMRQPTKRGQWTLDVHNALDTAWLDHISAYRALGIVAQGRWVKLGFSMSLEHEQKQP